MNPMFGFIIRTYKKVSFARLRYRPPSLIIRLASPSALELARRYGRPLTEAAPDEEDAYQSQRSENMVENLLSA